MDKIYVTIFFSLIFVMDFRLGSISEWHGTRPFLQVKFCFYYIFVFGLVKSCVTYCYNLITDMVQWLLSIELVVVDFIK